MQTRVPKKIMRGLAVLSLLRCLNACQDHTRTAPRLGTRVWNFSDRPVELQIRVGSILKKVHTLKPGSSKRLRSKTVYKAYMPQAAAAGDVYCNDNVMKGMRHAYYYDETCLPYIWIHDTGGNFSRKVKQQYLSLDDLRDYSEIRIYRDHQRGCVSVGKKPRAEFC